MSLPSPPTIPPLPFAKLAPSTYLTAHLSSSNPRRISNRTLLEPRVPNIHTGSLSHAHGSAVVRAGDTSAVCSVRGEILTEDDIVDWTPSPAPDYEEEDREDSPAAKRRRLNEKEDIARLNLLVPNIELATGCNPSNIPTGTGAPSVGAQVMTQRIETLLHTADIIPLSALRICSNSPEGESGEEGHVEDKFDKDEDSLQVQKTREVKAYWVLYIDIILLSLNGPAIDVAWLAMMAALRDTNLPHAEWDWDMETVVCDPEPRLARRLKPRDLPTVLTFGVFVGDAGSSEEKDRRRKWILADMDGFEESLCKETITIAMGNGGRVFRIEKGGGGQVNAEEIEKVVNEAESWRKRCNSILQEQK